MTAVESVAGRAAPPGRPARRATHLAGDLLALARPGQWPKNLIATPLALVDAPLWTVDVALRTCWAVLAFTLASSLTYVLNDLADRRLDRQHPTKRHRPVASGRVPGSVAWVYAAILAGLLGLAVAAAPAMPWWPLAAYLALNAAYSRWLKHVALLDICVVAGGFVLRALQGYLATGGEVSGWLLTAVFAGCLVLVIGKRRHELTTAGAAHRPALRGYNIAFADHMLGLNAGLAVAAFLLYVSADAPIGPYRQVVLLVTVPLLLLGVFRYLQSVLVYRLGGDPVRALLRDPVIVANAALLAAALGLALLASHYPVLDKAV